MKTLKLKKYKKTYTLTLAPTYYMDNGSLGIYILHRTSNEWEPYGTLTVNLEERSLGKNKAYVDTNNLGAEILDWITDNGLGELTGNEKKSGFCTYPEVLFYEEVLKQFNTEDYKQYLMWQKVTEGGKVFLFPSCNVCGKTFPILVTAKEASMYDEYLHFGKHLIQEVFPDMDPKTRALFTRGENVCGECWKSMFGFEEDIE